MFIELLIQVVYLKLARSSQIMDILKAYLTVFIDGLDIGGLRERSKDNVKASHLST